MIATRVIRHLQSLASSDLDWRETSPDRLQLCLRQTFGVVALVWYDIDLESSLAQVPTRLSEAFVALLDRLGRQSTVKSRVP
jgi:hypothetical protein